MSSLNGGIISVYEPIREPPFWLREGAAVFYLLMVSDSLVVLMWLDMKHVRASHPFILVVLTACYESVSAAHRYHQAKASGQGQGGQSKSSSAHSSRSTSPGPHWRNDGIAPYKPPDRRSMEPPSAPCAPSSSTRTGRSLNTSAHAEPDSATARTLLPRPPRDRSEPRHFNPLR